MKSTLSRLAAMAAGVACATTAFATLTPYSQNFEGLSMGDPNALMSDGWLVFGNVFNGTTNAYMYGYGPFGAPNGGQGFSAVATGEAGANQGTQYLNAYSDYNNGDHGAGHRIEANVFQEQIVGSSDLGTIAHFDFDFKASSTAGPAGSTTTLAFIKVLNPGAGYSLVAFETLDTTQASTTVWSEGNRLSVTIDSGWTGHLLQFGFLSNASNYEDSGVFYDNVSFTPVPEPASMAALALGAGALLRRRRKA